MNKRGNDGYIKTGIGKGFLYKYFHGKTYIHCLVELLKNSRDWGGALILIVTALARDLLRVVDNGRGMNKENRDSFCSINLTTAQGLRQSGLFGSGSKHMLFSHSAKVMVRTVADDEPESVYVFEFTADEYEQLVLAAGRIPEKRLPRNLQNWPYEFLTGTEITYKLKEPNSRGILRGEKLAEELSARLPRIFSDIVKVDEVNLPPKEVVGTFDVVEQHKVLGPVAFELYHPAKKRTEEDLRLTAVEVGEVPMENFFRVVGELRGSVPSIYLVPEVCGTISVSYLKSYASEDRFTLSPAVADDPRTSHFLRLLQNFAPEVQRRLRIKIKAGDTSDSDVQEIDEIADAFNQRYDPENKGPHIRANGPPPTEGEPPEPPESPTSKPALLLSVRHEFEPGEPIEITVKIRKDLTESYGFSDLEWHTEHSRAKKPKMTEKGLVMTAFEVGQGVVRMSLKGTPYSAEAHYQVVPARVFRLSMPFAQIEVGKELPIMAVNSDKLSGRVDWRLQGRGEIEKQGGLVLYQATHEGRAQVIGFDSSNPSTKASCEITVVPRYAKLMCIRGEFFIYDFAEVEGSAQYAKPATIIRGDKVHRMVFNQRAPGYQAAKKEGNLKEFMVQAIAQEFSRFAHLELQDRRLEDLDSRDLPPLYQEIVNDGFVVYDELLERTPSSQSIR